MALLRQWILVFNETPPASQVASHIAAAILGILITAGLWTPIAGALVAVVEVWIALAGTGNLWISITLAVLSATLVMIGPGAWSIDARLFGRKRFPG
jgi:putative oxidoreductase